MNTVCMLALFVLRSSFVFVLEEANRTLLSKSSTLLTTCHPNSWPLQFDAKDDEDADPSASIMNMMKDMYQNGDDEMRRVIGKAWTESREKQAPF